MELINDNLAIPFADIAARLPEFAAQPMKTVFSPLMAGASDTESERLNDRRTISCVEQTQDNKRKLDASVMPFGLGPNASPLQSFYAKPGDVWMAFSISRNPDSRETQMGIVLFEQESEVLNRVWAGIAGKVYDVPRGDSTSIRLSNTVHEDSKVLVPERLYVVSDTQHHIHALATPVADVTRAFFDCVQSISAAAALPNGTVDKKAVAALKAMNCPDNR